DMQPGQVYRGFTALRIEPIPDIRVTAYVLRHEKTEAEILHLHCEDRENLFSVGFRTPPADSTGIAHILEHSVLAGSEKYPVKDAFNELAKGTLQTFINAFTFPDKTVYPVASQVKADFFNLARVYADLVFHPLLHRETFLQEGHHLEFAVPEDIESNLTVSGIVYNEMKGAYSSPDNIMYKSLQQNLYPDTVYAYDSGGDPLVIPELTYSRLQAFHKAYYSPSNSRFFLYGDIPTREHLDFLAEILSGFKKLEMDSRIPSQPRFDAPARAHAYYPAGSDEGLRKKTVVNIAWALAETSNFDEVLPIQVVSEALVGSAAGPLRKALVDSGLGQDLSPVTGLSLDLKQINFAVGLRGTEPEWTGQIEGIIMETLRKAADEGIDRDIFEGALHQIEFSGKEIVRRYLPYSIILMQRAYYTWLYEGDPLLGLNFPRHIEKVRKRWKDNTSLFQEVIRKWFVDNPHRVVSVVEPSTTYLDEREESFRARMARKKAEMSRGELEKIRAESLELRKKQAEPDSPSALRSLPELKISEIPREIETIPTRDLSIGGVPALAHEIFANGIAYIEFAFDVSDIPDDLQPYLYLLGKLSTGVGAAGMSYTEMAKRISLKTGGLGFHLASGMAADGKSNWQKLIVQLKALHRNASDAVGIASDLLCAADFSDKGRVRDLVLESKNRLHSSVVPSGHMFARRTAAAALSVPFYRDEQWNGRSQLQLLSAVSERFEERSEDILKNISRLYREVFRRERLLINITGDEEGISLLAEAAEKRLSGLPAAGKGIGPAQEPVLPPVYSGVIIPAEVSYVAKAVPAAFYGDSCAPALLVLSRVLSNNYLYKRIRVQGGAYGGMSLYDPLNGIFSFLSYRDPNLAATMRVYEEAPDFISRSGIDGRELDKAVIGTIGSIDRPMDPAGKGYTAMVRRFSRLTDDLRKQFREGVLDTSEKALLDSAEKVFFGGMAPSAVAVYAAENRLKAANETLTRKLKIEPLI
ncbi:MAG: insulinase family protein, partial [Syntrophales bacterium]